jgi:group II intron reverse transcriptase/maturase
MENEFGGIAALAEKHQQVQPLMHYVNHETLKAEHEQQAKGKATGIDGVTKEEYGLELDVNIEALMKKLKAFSYRPQAVRRTYIPKAGSDKLRPLGIPSYEDKLVQGVMRRILDEIYEGKFCNFSYGFREGKSCHQAIREINQTIMFKRVNYIVDADIKGFFDNVNHEWLMKFLEHDIGDKNFLRYISRFLKAGIVEDLVYYESDKGTPQGGLISPILANVYLHYVLDIWFEKVVKKRCRGEAHIVRYADDFVCFFEYKEEAEKFFEALEERLGRFGLELSREKSKIIMFGRRAKCNSEDGKTETFDFLGFTHINGKTRTGKYRVVHRTSKKKLAVKHQSVKEWLWYNMHEQLSDTIKALNRKLRGHYAYYGISGNFIGIRNFYEFVVKAVYKVANRRSQRKSLTWTRYERLLEKFPILKPRLYVNIWVTPGKIT